ncbi:kinase-like protein [Dichomitus squalens LYAD-421 SS1]|uniref:Kinase-like protein n=1 Tax=Dichomitus squalens (strain LYAD-421) TaxID=732165 RepID=R7SUU5_DICSQ|nr:kinase-like protein [Dichomitus squalens LYAD-421 SS1]EJF59550.1 kinase-like protein [Dichomitus squalens LYAD-421 SS1]
MVTSPQSPASPTPPALGTYIDNGALQLVEILGYGGYGIVYRAVDTFSSNPTSYAVKCLPHSNKRSAVRQRQLHMREITLHQLASGHPNVVTLHRVIEDYQYTFIVMDYCSDGDLFTQILHQRRYLGNNALIKEVFLQLLDAVEYCHSLNIYHRDLKPENILCFEDGLRLAITDFGLATTERMSNEFRTGSVYHMSPECQGGYFAPTRSYSPLFNDVWSLGIILLNLITGRNPWKSASADDCTFQAYLKDPHRFLPTVLPISEEVNLLLTRVLEVDWRRRITLREMRLAFKSIDNFYSHDVIFEDSMARCPWEAGLNVDPDSDSSAEAEPEPQEVPEQQEQQEDFASAWSDGSDSEMVFARENSLVQKGTTSSWSASFDAQRGDDSAAPSSYSRSMSPSPNASPLYTTTKLFEALQTPGQSPASTYSVLSSSPSIPSPPVTPHAGSNWGESRAMRPKLVLTVDTDTHRPEYYDNSVTMLSATASSMHTALDTALESNWDGYVYSPLVTSAVETAKPSPYGDTREDFGMIITPATATEDHDMDEDEYPEIDTYDSHPGAPRSESPVLGLDLGANREHNVVDDAQSEYSWKQIRSWLNPYPHAATTTAANTTASNTPEFSFFTVQATPAPSRQPSPREPVTWPAFSFGVSTAPSSPQSMPEKLPPSRPSSPARRSTERKARTSSFLRPIRLAFPRRSTSPLGRRSRSPGRGKTRQTESAPEALANWVVTASTSGSLGPQAYFCLPPTAAVQPTHVRVSSAEKESVHPTHSTLTEDARPRRKRLRSARDWFSPGKLFAAVLPSS